MKNLKFLLKTKKTWVSRGGFKLDKAIRHFKVSCKDQIIMDIGSSTGGFIDVLLTNGQKSIQHRCWLWSIRLENKKQ